MYVQLISPSTAQILIEAKCIAALPQSEVQDASGFVALINISIR